MKKLRCCLCLILAGLLLCCAAMAEEVPSWTGKLTRDSRLRAEKRNDSEMLDSVRENQEVLVYALEDGWYRVSLDGQQMGWLPEDRVYEIRSISDRPAPGYQHTEGLATLRREVQVSGPGRTSELLPAGTLIAACSDGTVPFMRGWAQLPEDGYSFVPYAFLDDAAPGDALFAFTTWYNDRTGAQLAQNRRRNIALAAERTNGTVLAPGETFSYNEKCAPYRIGNGYVDAPNITKDGHGVGGGVCQLSTTIYNAVLGLPLRVDEWQVHRVSGVSYVPKNLDACVSNRLDLRFTNTLEFAISIETVTQNGALTCIIRRAVTP